MKKAINIRIDEEALEMAGELMQWERERTGYQVSRTQIIEKAVREMYAAQKKRPK